MAGLQCPKRLWFEANARERLAPTDAATQAIFDQGHEVGRLAQELYPGGLEIARDRLAWKRAIAATGRALGERVPLYEAAFAFEGGACRVDILAPAGRGGWDLVEVKSTTEVKDVHLADLAFQTWVLAGAGIAVRRSYLAHLNRDYVRKVALDPHGLFVLEDLTERIEPLLAGVGPEVARLGSVLPLAEAPEAAIGPHCSDPYDCPVEPICWSEIPAGSVFTLYRGGKKSWELHAGGIVELAAIPDDFPLTDSQAIQVAAARSGRAHVEPARIRSFLGQLEYPLHYFDLESYALAIPPFDGTRPYQQIPFQFSLHGIEAPGATPRATAFLAEGNGDPRPEFLAAVRAALGPRGSIVAYNASFERDCLSKCAEAFPEHAAWIAKLIPRFVDLLEPFRSFAFYDPAQLGSASLKAVLPVLAGRGYEELEIQEGGAAAREYLRSLDPATAPAERERIRRALLAYCGRDTEGMVEVVEALGRLARGGGPRETASEVP
jgi:CRISPR/Cas system-associated exonuclease Cas4 (RecB family)